MGTHPSGPSVVLGDDVDDEVNKRPLLDVLRDFPEYVGCMKTAKKCGADLPFLFKVLSVREPLSIQTHPDKTLAAKLHVQHPDRYPDGNHKPEMAIAITDFCALCSFRPHADIVHNLQTFAELKEIVGARAADGYVNAKDDDSKTAALKLCFANLMNASAADIARQLQAMNARFKCDAFKKLNDVRVRQLTRAFDKLYAFYPEDVGCFCLFFLNYLELKPGEALFLAANEPHAYISGGKTALLLAIY